MKSCARIHSAVSAALLGYVWRHRADRLTRVFLVLLVAILLYSTQSKIRSRILASGSV